MSEEIGLDKLCKGDEVFLASIKKWAILMDDPKDKKKFKVARDAFSFVVGPEDIIKGRKAEKSLKSRRNNIRIDLDRSSRLFSECPTLDLHRLTLEEAIEKLDRFLDSAALNGIYQVRVIHGHGAGILKKGIRKYLKESSYVSSFHAPPQHEGGDGVSLVELNY